ncbi:hypothetical protein PI124_g19624 [Phytophthora idaei]|nr:hypothetical protein PI126_g23671 [Phytophthora idaei]KAG3235340.1 hypothetical protein PI124_g19624 [Phytophthora idaei]
MVAARAGNGSILRVLFKRGSQVDATAKDGSTALHLAAHNGYIDACRVLIGGGANVDAAGLNPLMKAVQMGHIGVTKLLLKSGADSQATTSPKISLHLAVENGIKDMLELLLDQVKRVDAIDDKGFTPLMVASQRGNDAVIEQLIARKANVEACANDGSNVLHFTVRCGHLTTCKILLKGGAPINAVDVDGVMPLMDAISRKSMDIIGLLLAENADVSAATKEGTTVLHFAVTSGAV